jgi:tetratricopeptide (TPR) repeat protein
LCCLLFVSAAQLAASDDDFYQRLYQRGMTHFAAADYAVAFTELRSAAFGFIDRVEQFEIAQSYASVAAHRLGHDSDARDSLMRIVSAEKVQPRYRSIKLPDAVRAEVDSIAANVLTAQEAKLLGVTAISKPPVDVPTPGKRPNVALTAPDVRSADAAPPSVVSNPPDPTAVPSVDASMHEAERAVDARQIDRARSIYNSLLDTPSLAHDALLRVAQGLYVVDDFAGAVCAYQRAGTLAHGEERDHYYYAVALYEMGQYDDAKRELSEALLYIPVTPDIARYRLKIGSVVR